MTSSAKWSLVGVVIVLAVLVALVPRLIDTSNAEGSSEEGMEASTSVIAQRPDCIGSDAAGVELPCLGGAAGADNAQAAVINLWAWWCEPCRAELPIFDQFAAAHPELNVMGVHADANASNGAAMLNDLDIELASFQDDSNLFAGTLGLPSVVPITIVVSPEGDVLQTFPRTFESLSDLENAVGEVL